MIMGSVVLMPWPISGFLAMIVTMPSGAMLINAQRHVVIAKPAATAPPAALLRLGRFRIQSHQQAAAGESGHAKEGATIDIHRCS